VSGESKEGREKAEDLAAARKRDLLARGALAFCAAGFFSLIYVFIMYTDVVNHACPEFTNGPTRARALGCGQVAVRSLRRGAPGLGSVGVRSACFGRARF
jgi:hypothetical protein